MIAPLVVLAALLGQADAGVGSPPAPGPGEPEWSGFPGETAPPEAARPAPAPRPSGAESLADLPMPPTVEEPLGPPRLAGPRPEPANRVSLHGAAPLGSGQRALGLGLGFPLLGGRALMGVTQALDLGLSYETLYGLMHDVRAVARLRFGTNGMVTGGLAADVGWAFFTRAPVADLRGARWLTGRRNWNATLGPVISLQGSEPRASRFFAGARAQLAADTQPVSQEPLGGVPPPVVLSLSLLTEAGLEVPVSEWVALAFRVGLDLHGRPEDSSAMVNFAAGVVTALP